MNSGANLFLDVIQEQIRIFYSIQLLENCQENYFHAVRPQP